MDDNNGRAVDLLEMRRMLGEELIVELIFVLAEMQQKCAATSDLDETRAGRRRAATQSDTDQRAHVSLVFVRQILNGILHARR